MNARASVLVALAAIGVVAACGNPASAEAPDKFPDATRAAAADLAAVVAQAHVAGSWQVARLSWDSVAKATIAEVSTPVEADRDDPLADPPTIVAGTFALAIGPPVRILTHADPAELRAALTTAPAAIAVARARLQQEPRYLGWKAGKTRYETDVRFLRGRVFVMFSPPRITDSEISIEVDPATDKVVAVRLGMA